MIEVYKDGKKEVFKLKFLMVFILMLNSQYSNYLR